MTKRGLADNDSPNDDGSLDDGSLDDNGGLDDDGGLDVGDLVTLATPMATRNLKRVDPGDM